MGSPSDCFLAALAEGRALNVKPEDFGDSADSTSFGGQCCALGGAYKPSKVDLEPSKSGSIHPDPHYVYSYSGTSDTQIRLCAEA